MNIVLNSFLAVTDTVSNQIEEFTLKYIHRWFPNDYIICLHDVTDTCNSKYDITPEKLRGFFLSCDRKLFIRLNDMISSSQSQRGNTNRYTITFDDGLESVYTYVYPLMKELEIPFTCYITTSSIDKDGYLSSDQIRSLASDPLCEIGSHMVSHRRTRGLSVKEILDEWSTSKDVLLGITEKCIKHAALPYGSLLSCSRKSIRLAFEAGYSSVATTSARPFKGRSRILPRCTYKMNFDVIAFVCKCKT